VVARMDIFRKYLGCALTLLLLLSGCASQQGSQSAEEVPEIHALCYGYSYGREGLEQNDEQALIWCNKGHAEGFTSSTVLLAEAYYLGRGVAVDKNKAAELYEHAANNGHAHAQYVMARLILDPLNDDPNALTPDDLARGYGYLKDAASAGHEDAQVLVAALSDEPGVAEEEDEIVDFEVDPEEVPEGTTMEKLRKSIGCAGTDP